MGAGESLMSLTLSKKAKAVKPSSTLAITAKAKELKAKGIDVVGFEQENRILILLII